MPCVFSGIASFCGGRGSVVGIATTLRAGRFEDRIRVGARLPFFGPIQPPV